jgi:hypothetical protein
MTDASPACCFGRSACAVLTVFLLHACDVSRVASDPLVPARVVHASIVTPAVDPVRACLEMLSDPALKQLYLDCTRGAVRSVLARGDIQTCSLVYDVLLNRTLDSDFLALWSWSKDETDSEASASR